LEEKFQKRETIMDIGPPELVILLLIVVLLFGVGRISKVAGELGSGFRAFREGLHGSEPPAQQGEVEENTEGPKTE
jgi:sec-independent protein translocase protein TatA